MTRRDSDDDKGPKQPVDLTDHGVDKNEREVALVLLGLLERLILLVVVIMTLGGAVSEIMVVIAARTITLADILLMFLYAEIISMVTVFYANRNAVFVYPILIAITALSRLVILQGKDMAPENILFEAISILLLTIAAMIIIRLHKV